VSPSREDPRGLIRCALVAIGLGPLLSAIPATVVALTVSPTLAPGVVVFYIALLLGGSLLGAIGAILAVPTAAILHVIFEELAPESGEH